MKSLTLNHKKLTIARKMSYERLSRLQKWILINTFIQRKFTFSHKIFRERRYFLERKEIYHKFFGQGKNKKPVETKVRVSVTRSLINLERKGYIDTEAMGQKLFLTERGVRRAQALMKEALVFVVRKNKEDL